MSCPHHPEISAYLDDMLAPARRERLRAHLETCPLCRRRLDELQQMQQALRALPSPTLGFDLAARLEDRLRAAPARPRRPSWFGWSAAGTTVALSLATGAWLGGLLVGGSVAGLPAAGAPAAGIARVFDPVPPGGLCAAAELCRLSKGLQ